MGDVNIAKLDWGVVLLILAVSMALPTAWWVVCFLFSRGGWSEFAARFPAVREPPKDLRIFTVSARFWSGPSYSRCVHATLTEEGIHLEMMPLFAAGHRPLLIPWQMFREVKVEKSLLGGWVDVTTYSTEGSPTLMFPKRALGELRARVPPALPGREAADT